MFPLRASRIVPRVFLAPKKAQELVGNQRGEHIEVTDNVRLSI
jgi:hypothetical protein